MTAVIREMSYPQFHLSYRWLSWANPPSMGRILVLFCYWAVIIYMMSADAIVADAYFWERVGFRNAWVTITQLPLVYLLSTKTNIIGLLIGTSHERLNWLHRWVARTMFVTATVHGFHFWTQWVLADFVEIQLQMMPSIKYGLGAWAVLLWTVLTSFRPLRHVAYETFVIQHILSAVFFLWLVYVHVPAVAKYNIWFAVAIWCFDRAGRVALLVWQNVRFRPNRSPCVGGKRLGHHAQVRAFGKSTTIVTIKDVHFRWSAGQHLYLWLPQVGPVEAHPYTIACAHQVPETCICNSIQLVVRVHSGFSKRLNEFARKLQDKESREHVTAFVSGPYGNPPNWHMYETLILISASTGASFTLPILESVVDSTGTSCIKSITFILATRQGDEVDFYVQRLRQIIDQAHGQGLEVEAHIALTGSGGSSDIISKAVLGGRSSSSSSEVRPVLASSVMSADTNTKLRKFGTNDVEKGDEDTLQPITTSPAQEEHRLIRTSTCRPNIEELIRTPIEASGGETSVVVCGGQSLVSRVRNTVASLSDERAVHKGTGAQGIHLHVEEYCF
jgi:NAD(P)H-flavin reductase